MSKTNSSGMSLKEAYSFHSPNDQKAWLLVWRILHYKLPTHGNLKHRGCNIPSIYSFFLKKLKTSNTSSFIANLSHISRIGLLKISLVLTMPFSWTFLKLVIRDDLLNANCHSWLSYQHLIILLLINSFGHKLQWWSIS